LEDLLCDLPAALCGNASKVPDLDLRPIYHKNDDAYALEHLDLGLLAYSLVNTIRYQLKAKGIHHDWQEIVCITNTQKVVSTYGKNIFEETIYVRRCTEPNEKVKTIYQALGYRNYPFVKRKSVVHKSEFKKINLPVFGKLTIASCKVGQHHTLWENSG